MTVEDRTRRDRILVVNSSSLSHLCGVLIPNRIRTQPEPSRSATHLAHGAYANMLCGSYSSCLMGSRSGATATTRHTDIDPPHRAIPTAADSRHGTGTITRPTADEIKHKHNRTNTHATRGELQRQTRIRREGTHTVAASSSSSSFKSSLADPGPESDRHVPASASVIGRQPSHAGPGGRIGIGFGSAAGRPAPAPASASVSVSASKAATHRRRATHPLALQVTRFHVPLRVATGESHRPQPPSQSTLTRYGTLTIGDELNSDPDWVAYEQTLVATGKPRRASKIFTFEREHARTTEAHERPAAGSQYAHGD